MKQLFDWIYLLEGQVGLRPLYLPVFWGKNGVLIMDTGCARHVDELILPGFASIGIQPDELRFVLSSHPDSDHVGGNAGIQRWAPQVLFCCGDADRELVQNPEELFRLRYDAYRPFGVFYAEEVARGIMRDLGEAQSVHITFRGGERLRLGPDQDLEVLALQGHSHGHLGLYDRRNRALFGADAIQGSVYLDVNGNPALCPTYLYPETYLQTCQLIENLDLDYYVSCHWPIKKGPEIGQFCQETRTFVQRADLLLRQSGITDLRAACLDLGPKLGKWPEQVHFEMAYALAGHLGLQ
ncbi:MAG: MBL fold metallo-hydrolase [Verrucomicrobia bacterium]|nr:MBL fold metallo-hydrolase [Verrucomicrobiota bacterium]